MSDRLRTFYQQNKGLLIVLVIIAALCLVADKSHVYSVVNTPSENSTLFALNKGEYELAFNAKSDAGTSWKLVDYRQNDGNNNLGKVICEGLIGAGDVSFPTDNNDYLYRANFKIQKDSDQIVFEVRSDKEQTVLDDRIRVTLIDDDYTDSIVGFIILSIIVTFLYFSGLYKDRNVVILLAALSVLSLVLFEPSLKNGDDIAFHLNRIKGLADEIRRLHFPAIMNTSYNLGYGVETSVFYPELFLYPSALLMVAGVSLTTAYKWLIVLINAATLFVGFFSFKRLFNSDRMALIAVLMYAFAPYRLTTLYIRAAIGESLALAFMPYLIYGIVELFYGGKRLSWVHSVIGVSLIMQSHILSLEISAIVIVIVGLIFIISGICTKKSTNIKDMMLAAVSVVLINMWFIVPFLMGMKNGDAGIDRLFTPSKYAIHPWMLFLTFDSLQGSMSRTRTTDSMMVSVGSCLALAACYFIYLWISGRLKRDRITLVAKYCVIFGLLCAWMCTYFFPWNYVEYSSWGKHLTSIQYAWRMSGFACIFLIIPATLAVDRLLEDNNRVLLGILAVLFVASSANCVDSIIRDNGNLVLSSNECISFAKNTDYYNGKYEYRYIDENGDRIVYDDDSIAISNYSHDGTNISFDYEKTTSNEISLAMPLYDYGCYRVYINGGQIEEEHDKLMRVSFKIPEDELSGTVEVRYWIRKRNLLSAIISAGSILLLFGYCRRCSD